MSNLLYPQVDRPVLPTMRDLLSRIFRHRRLFLIIFLIVVLLSIGAGLFKKTYQAQMSFLVRKERVDSLLTPVQNSTPDLQVPSVSEEDLNSEVELLKGPDLLRQVVLKAKILPEGKQDPESVAVAVRSLERRLDVEAIPKTHVIVAKYTASDPASAERVLRDLGTLYLREHKKLRGSSEEVSFLNESAADHKAAWKKAEQKLLAFTEQTKVISASLERDATVEQMKHTEQEAIEAHAAVLEAEQRSAALSRELALTDPRVATLTRHSQNPQLLEEIRAKLLDLQLKKADLMAKYDSQYRLVRDVDDQIAIAQGALADQAKAPLEETSEDANPVLPKLRADLADSHAELAGLRAREAALATAADSLNQEASTLQQRDIEQEELLQDAKNERDQYQLYQDKSEQAQMGQSLDQQGILNIVIAQPAFAPPIPQRSLGFAILAVLFMGVLFGSCVSFVADLFDPTVRAPADLEEILGSSFIEDFAPMPFAKRGAA